MGGVCPIAFCERLCVAGHHEQSRRRWRGCQGGGKCPSSIEQAVARLHVNMGRGDVRRVQHIADATEGLRKGGRIAVCGQKRGRKNLDARVPPIARSISEQRSPSANTSQEPSAAVSARANGRTGQVSSKCQSGGIPSLASSRSSPT